MTETDTRITQSSLLLDALTGLIEQNADRYGVYLDGVTGFDVRALARRLGGPGQVYVSVVGLPEADALVEWARGQGWDERGFGTGATHAVSVRNDAPADALKLAIVAAAGERLHSLRERHYLRLSAVDVMHEVARIGCRRAGNHPQESLWMALMNPAVASTLSLPDVLAYAVAVFNDADSLSAPRRHLPQLGLLPDPDLFRKSSPSTMAERLVRNRDLVEQLLRANPDDRQKAYAALQAAGPVERESLEEAYAALLRLGRGDTDALDSLTFSSVQLLLKKRKPQPPPPEPPTVEEAEVDYGEDADEEDLDDLDDDREENHLATATNPTEAAIQLTARNEGEMVQQLAEQASHHLAEQGAEATELQINGTTVPFTPDARALDLARALVDEERYGGTVHLDVPLEEALKDLGPLLGEVRFVSDQETTELLFYMERAEEVLARASSTADFAGKAHLEDYLARRKALLPHLDLLATDPLLALAASDEIYEAVQASVNAYVRLLSHLKEQFPAVHGVSRDGAVLIAAGVLQLDVAVFRGYEEAAVVLPLNPLSLWKHLELATVIRERSSTLALEDLNLLAADLSDLPEPLLTLYAPGGPEEEALEMAHVGRIGLLPLYRPAAVRTADVDGKSIEDAAQRLTMLYPPARNHLRLLLLDPESLDPTSRALRRLFKGRNPFGHVTLTVITTGDHRPPDVDSTLGELHAQGRVTIRQQQLRSPDDAASYLARHPVHLLVISGRRQTNVGTISREATRLHPLSVPHRLVADPITQEVRLEPRSVRPEEEADLQHPYGSYSDVVNALLNRRQDPANIDRRLTRELDFDALAEHAQFCLVAGAGDSRVNDNLLYLAQRGPHADEVFTSHDDRIVTEIERLLRGWNYEPRPEALRTLLDRLEELGGEGLFAAFSAKERGGLAHNKLREKVGLAVALDWYRQQAADGDYLILSLDGPPARAWLGRRVESRRADLLGFRRTPEGTVAIEVIEVKSYQATGERAAEDTPADQLRAVAHVIASILSGSGDLLLDRRRELLRRQVYMDGLLAKSDPAPDWVTLLNQTLDGDADAAINLLLVELALEEPGGATERLFNPPGGANAEEVARLPLRRVRLGEQAIQPFLDGLLRRPQQVGEQGTLIQPSPTERAPGEDAEQRTLPSPPQQDREDTDEGGEPAAQPPLDSPQPPAPAGQVVPADGAGDAGSRGFEPNAEEQEAIRRKAGELYRALQDYGIRTEPVDADLADVGPSIVRYKVRLRPGEQLGKIRRIAEELMRELALEKEPIVGNLPGTTFVHVDLPRPERHVAPLLPVLDAVSPETVQPCTVPAGITPDGHIEWVDITTLPHMLVAGATQAGKSMFLYTLIGSLARLNTPDRLHLVLVDPKRTDFGFFRRLPHLHGRGVITDPAEAVAELTRLIDEEMEQRTDRLEEAMYLNIHSYNDDHPDAPIPLIVVVIDEFADLADVMDTREQREAFDLALRRLAQRARSVGIHLVIATQRPTADIINGTIKANLPCRVSFRLGSNVDSRTILDEGGAEHLFGRGDMLLKKSDQTTRLQGFFLDENDLRQLVRGIM